jgi:hypothetical protein
MTTDPLYTESVDEYFAAEQVQTVAACAATHAAATPTVLRRVDSALNSSTPFPVGGNGQT